MRLIICICNIPRKTHNLYIIIFIRFQECHESNMDYFIDSSCNPEKWLSRCISALRFGTRNYRTVSKEFNS